MPYIVVRGDVHHSGRIYGPGEALPIPHNKLRDAEAIGVVEWRDARLKENADLVAASEPEPAEAEETPVVEQPKPKKRGRKKVSDDADGS